MDEGDASNCYILLELDPAIDDTRVIEAQVRKKQREWSNTSESAKDKRKVQLALQKVKFIRDTLLDPKDPDKRRREARRAAGILAQRKEQLSRLIHDAVDLLRSAGTFTDANVATIAAASRKAGLVTDVEAQFVAAGLKRAATPATSKPSRLDDTIEEMIASNLKVVEADSLYAFLGLQPNASAKALCQRAEDMRKTLRSAGHTHVEATAQGELLGLCKQVFRDESEKQKYDRTLALARMHELKPLIEVAGGDRLIDFARYGCLIEKAQQRGIDAALARDYIVEHARKRKWAVVTESAAGARLVPTQRCGFCRAIAPEKAKRCSGCGEELTTRCPKCNTAVPTEAHACGACGFAIGDWTWIKFRIDEARQLADSGRLDQARDQLAALLGKWPEWGPISAQLEAVSSRIAAREEQRRQITDLVRRAHLFEAEAKALQFDRRWGEGSIGTLPGTIAQGLQRARAEFDAATRRRAAGQSEEAIAYYRTALTICADFDAARKALAQMPPVPPTDLVVTRRRDGFELRWRAAVGAVDGYVAVRKADQVPVHADDGVWRQAVTDLVASDPAPGEGVAWQYAVFSRRDDVASAQAARSGPHLRLAAVRRLVGLAGDGEVKLTWRLPNGAAGVEAWRRPDGVPEGSETRIALSPCADALHDAGLANDVAVSYRIFALFPDPVRPGALLQGPAAACRATPTRPPAAVMDLRAQRQADGVSLSWTLPGQEVEIRLAHVEPRCRPAAILTSEEADALGAPVLSTRQGSAHVALTSTGEFWFVPITRKGTIAVVGTAVRVAIVEGMRNLAAHQHGHDLQLTWDWPPGATRAVVCHSPERPPAAPDDRGAICHQVTLAAYRQGKGFSLRRLEPCLHHVAVFAVTEDGRLHSEPLAATVQLGPPREVRYRFVPRAAMSPTGTPQLEISGQGTLPATVLVGKRRHVPTSPADGELLMRLPRMELAGTRRLMIETTTAPGSLAKLFFEDPRHATEITLVAPSPNESRL